MKINKFIIVSLVLSFSPFSFSSCIHDEISDLQSGSNAIDPGCVIDIDSLFDRREGHARKATGGEGSGYIYVVTSLADSGAGTLREALSLGSSWIVFDVSGTIDLDYHLNVPSDVTIDGRGQDVKLEGYGLKIHDAENVIVENITIMNGVSTTNDAVQIIRSNKVWIDHVSLKNFPDGLIDTTYASEDKTRVTVSWSLFENHNKTMIVGLHSSSAPDDSDIYATVHHNFFSGTNQRHPRVAQANVHAYNNVIDFNIIGSQSYEGAKLLLEGNYFTSLDSTRTKATDYDLTGYIDGILVAPTSGSSANILSPSGVYVATNGALTPPSYTYTLENAADNCVKQTIELNAGHHDDLEADKNLSQSAPSVPTTPVGC